MAAFAKVNTRVEFRGFSRHENFASDENRRRRESRRRIYKLPSYTCASDPFPRECGRKFFADRSALVSIRPMSVTRILPLNIRCWTRSRRNVIMRRERGQKFRISSIPMCRGYFHDVPERLSVFLRKSLRRTHSAVCFRARI